MMRARDKRTRHLLGTVSAAVVTALCLHAGLALSAEPRLSQPLDEATAADSIAGLRQSLETLARNMDRQRRQAHASRSAALQSALTRLASGPAPSSERLAPRLSGGQHAKNPADGDALSMLASRLLAVQQGFPQTQGPYEASGIDDLRQAMRRFDVVTDTVVSETFSTVLLGLSDMTPTLSDDLMSHPRVAKNDLLERVVDARVPAIAAAPAPLVGYIGPSRGTSEPAADIGSPGKLASIDDTALVEGEEIAGLDGPVGEPALDDIAAITDRPWTDTGVTDAQYAMQDEVLLDEIDIDGLGDAEIASLDGAVATDDLLETRAGFMLPNGVRIDFAVTRLTSVDGLDELHSIASLPAGLDATTLSQISGSGFTNTQILSPTDAGSSMFTLIQNNLDNQRIVDVTTIDIGIKNLGVRAGDFVPRSLIPINPLPLKLDR